MEIEKLRKGARIKLRNGETLVVRGAYISTGGLVVTANENGAGLVDRNVPVAEIMEVVDAS